MPRKKIDATQRMHLWLETENGMFMGLGRVQLLERIDRIDQTKLEEGFRELLARFKRNLTTGAGTPDQ